MHKLTASDDLDAPARAWLAGLDGWLVAESLTFDPHELTLVYEMARSVDRMAQIRAALARLDPATESPAWVRLCSEERQLRLAYGRHMSTLALPTGVVDPEQGGAAKGRTPRSRRAQKAARARWGAAA